MFFVQDSNLIDENERSIIKTSLPERKTTHEPQKENTGVAGGGGPEADENHLLLHPASSELNQGTGH